MRGRILTASGCSAGGTGGAPHARLGVAVVGLEQLLHALDCRAARSSPLVLARGARAGRTRAAHDRAAAAADPLQHGQSAGQRAGGAGVPARACSRAPASSASCSRRSRGGRTSSRACAAARTARGSRYLGHVDTVLADPGDWTRRPVVGRAASDGCVWGRGALDMKSQVAAEVAAAVALAEEGWRPESGELLVIVTADEEAGADARRPVALRAAPDKVRCDFVVNEGGGELVDVRRAAASTGSCVAEKGVFRFTLTTDGRAGPRVDPADRRQRADQDGAAARGAGRAPAVARAAARSRRRSSRALGRRARRRPRRRRVDDVAARDPRIAVLLEPMLGVTLTPTMIERVGEDQRDPRARASCRSTAACRPSSARTTRARAIAEVIGDDGYELEFDETVIGNRSPIDTALMDEIREFVEREDPGARGGADRAARASPTRAGSARRSPTASPTASSRQRRWTCSRPRR